MNHDFEESGKRDHVNINDFDVLNRISSIINSEFGSNDAPPSLDISSLTLGVRAKSMLPQ